MAMIEIDGSEGEGGGQILRTSLALSVVTGQPFRLVRVRAGRAKPGLAKQHVTAVRAAAACSRAEVSGDREGSHEVVFRPRGLAPGRHRFDLGGAGSTTLVLQTILPALAFADGESHVELVGGTHNPMAPSFDFLNNVFVPLARRAGWDVELTLERAGFYPRGGGVLVARIGGRAAERACEPLTLAERGAVRAIELVAMVAALEPAIAERELDVLAERLAGRAPLLSRRAVELDRRVGPGNAAWVMLESEHAREVFAAPGEKGVRAEAIASGLAREVEEYLESGAPVGPHLCDQLLLPLALGPGGSFVASAFTEHARTQIATIRRFLPTEVDVREDGSRVAITVRGSRAA
ncbi:MAG: RNA 3'-terminal phosphate cyclase [Polyangiaceae bacterium]